MGCTPSLQTTVHPHIPTPTHSRKETIQIEIIPPEPTHNHDK